MRRIFVALLLVALLASPAAALKKTLLVVPGEYTSTGWLKFAVSALISQNGGTYETIYMTADTTGILGKRLYQARASGDFGLVVYITKQQDANESDITGTSGSYIAYGQGKYSAMADIRGTIGIPLVVVSRAGLSRASSANFRCGTTCADNWARGASGAGDPRGYVDSLWVRLSTGDSVLWHKETGGADKRHILATTSSPENTTGRVWTVDAWTKKGSSTAAPGQGASVNFWHVHFSAYDAAEIPGEGQDSVIYYLPGCGYTPDSYDSELKVLASLLVKYDCIKSVPISVFYDDYGFPATFTSDLTKAQYWAASDAFLQYCSNEEIPVMVNLQYAKAGGWGSTTQDTAYVVANMAKWYDDPCVRFGWHVSDLYANKEKSSSYTTFTTWGDGATEVGNTLLRDLRRDKYLLGTSGMLQYMTERDAFIFNAGDYNGIGGATPDKTDTIFQALAAVGVRTFLLETPFAGYYADGSIFMTMFYPHDKYPLNLDWTGTASYVDVKIVSVNYRGLSFAQTDSALATPAALTDSQLVNTVKPYAISSLYNFFRRVLFNSGREQDATGTRTWNDAGAAQWPNYYNLELRGWSPYVHQAGLAIRKNGVYYNSGKLWLEHYWNNLRAYNNLAKKDAPTRIRNVFQPVFLTEAEQRTSGN